MTQILTTLKSVIFDIFGDMFFMFPDEYDEPEPFPADWIKYQIKISMETAFYLSCYFTPGQAKLMAENFLGEAAEIINDEIIGETLKEAVNVVGGNLLNRLGDDYHLGIPENVPTEPAAELQQKLDAGEAVLLNVEDAPFLATLTSC